MIPIILMFQQVLIEMKAQNQKRMGTEATTHAKTVTAKHQSKASSLVGHIELRVKRCIDRIDHMFLLKLIKCKS